jgi:hypothetical protein
MQKDVKEPLNSLPEVECTLIIGSYSSMYGSEWNRKLSVQRLMGEIKH